MTTKKLPKISPPQISERQKFALATLLLFLFASIPFLPALNGAWIWDDRSWITENPVLTLPGLEGLVTIWTQPKALLHYYPLVYSTFWVEYRLFGLSPTAFHTTNLLLHASAALLLWLTLRRLSLRAAWLGALFWAIHPVQVETVAWAAERKNVLCALFCFLTAWLYLLFDEALQNKRPLLHLIRLYALAFLAFLLAMTSKTIACTLPAALAVLILYRHKDLLIKKLLPLLPLLIVGLLLAIITIKQETQVVLPLGTGDYDWSFPQRILIASRSILFYLASLVWPYPLMLNNPRWYPTLADPLVVFSLLFSVGLFPALYFLRSKITLGPLVAYAIFIITISPALGFINFYTMMYFFAADHYQYIACAPILVLFAEALFALPRLRIPPTILTQDRLRIAAAVIALYFAAFSWFYSTLYKTNVQLWSWTVVNNDEAWIAHQNLSVALLALDTKQGALLAREHAARALQLRPNDDRTNATLASILLRFSDWQAAEALFKRAIELSPQDDRHWQSLTQLYYLQGRLPEARDACARALALAPHKEVYQKSLAILEARLATAPRPTPTSQPTPR